MKTSLFKTSAGANYLVPFALISSLFLLWGFCNGLIDVLDKHFQNVLHITKAQSALVQFANYMGYFLMALPAGGLARRFGYKGGIIVGLALIAAGAFCFIPATRIGAFWAFLGSLFILACGLTCLETIANPYATVLGPAATGAARINLAQSFNGIGWILGPVVGGHVVFAHGGAAGNGTLYLPYLGIGIVVALLAVFFVLLPLPEIVAEDDYAEAGSRGAAPSLWSHPHFVLAVAAQFLYVAAQTGIFSFFINYIDTETPALAASFAGRFPEGWVVRSGDLYRVTELGASQLLSWGGFVLFLLGRFTGSLLLRRYHAHRVLALFSIAGAALLFLVVLHWGWVSVAALFLTFYFISIMFPTLFALGIHGLGAQTKKASSFLVMSIVGGALMPIAMGAIADRSSMSLGFVVPLGCLLFIAGYALAWTRLSRSEGLLGVSTARGH